MGWPGPITNRQYLAWHSWLDRQSNIPSRADFYAMQIAATVQQANSTKSVDINKFKLKLKKEKGKKKIKISEAELLKREKAIALARVTRSGIKPTIITVDKNGNRN